MALKWIQDTQTGLKTNLACRYILIYLGVSTFLFVFVGLGFMLLWQGLLRVLLTLAPFSHRVAGVLGQMGLSVEPPEKLRIGSRFRLWFFVVARLLVASAYLAFGIFIIAKTGFSLSLIGILWMILRR